MQAMCRWKSAMSFEAVNRQHTILMDAKPPFGKDQAASPKELLLDAMCGCTAMDVVSLLRKAKEEPTAFTVEAHTDLTGGHPSVFKHVHLVYRLEGAAMPQHVVDAVEKSMSLYCGVSAMIAKACPITYEIHVNGAQVAASQAQFP